MLLRCHLSPRPKKRQRCLFRDGRRPPFQGLETNYRASTTTRRGEALLKRLICLFRTNELNGDGRNERLTSLFKSLLVATTALSPSLLFVCLLFGSLTTTGAQKPRPNSTYCVCPNSPMKMTRFMRTTNSTGATRQCVCDCLRDGSPEFRHRQAGDFSPICSLSVPCVQQNPSLSLLQRCT